MSFGEPANRSIGGRAAEAGGAIVIWRAGWGVVSSRIAVPSSSDEGALLTRRILEIRDDLLQDVPYVELRNGDFDRRQ
jgi:hypothetical protein